MILTSDTMTALYSHLQTPSASELICVAFCRSRPDLPDQEYRNPRLLRLHATEPKVRPPRPDPGALHLACAQATLSLGDIDDDGKVCNTPAAMAVGATAVVLRQGRRS